MMHLSEGDLLAYLDGALGPDRRVGVERHLSGCAECGTELNELRRVAAEFTLAVAMLDRAAPPPREFVPPRQWAPMGIVAGARGALLKAALIVLLVGGVAWGALPGSPVRGWIGQVWGGDAAMLEGRSGAGPAASTLDPDTQAGAIVSGISLLPVDGEARAVLRGMEPATRLRVRLVDGAQLTVQWTGSGADPAFRTAAGRVEVLRGGAGALLIEVPRASRTLIEVDGRIIAIAEAGLLRPLIAAEGAGDELVFPRLKERG
jgi:anti-sigma factor RsiW